jgi:hypothetical protein
MFYPELQMPYMAVSATSLKKKASLKGRVMASSMVDRGIKLGEVEMAMV